MSKDPNQWLLQADYDLAAALTMLSGGRYLYVVFMCHLAIEKSLKGLYQKKLNEFPPKTHNLIYFLNKIGLKPPEHFGKFIVSLNEASVVTRYPEDLNLLQKDYSKSIVEDILKKSQELLIWIKNQF